MVQGFGVIGTGFIGTAHAVSVTNRNALDHEMSLVAIVEGGELSPIFTDPLGIARVIHAIDQSVRGGRRVEH